MDFGKATEPFILCWRRCTTWLNMGFAWCTLTTANLSGAEFLGQDQLRVEAGKEFGSAGFASPTE